MGSPPAQHAHRGAVSEAPEEPEGPGAVTSQSVHTAVHGRRHRNKTAEDATGEGLKNLSLSRKQREAREAFYPEKQTAGSLGRTSAVALGPPPRPGCTRAPPPTTARATGRNRFQGTTKLKRPDSWSLQLREAWPLLRMLTVPAHCGPPAWQDLLPEEPPGWGGSPSSSSAPQRPQG